MTTLQCRNCGSSDRYAKEVVAQGAYGFNILPIKESFFKVAKYRVEVCGSCGLTEWFVPDRYMDQVMKTFSKISD